MYMLSTCNPVSAVFPLLLDHFLTATLNYMQQKTKCVVIVLVQNKRIIFETQQ